MGNNGYIYKIGVSVRYVDSSVELPMKWCYVVYLCQQLLDVLPPSTVPRGRPISEGMVNVLRSYNPVVSLMCLWTCVLCLFYNFNFGWILEEHGCHDWSVSHWPIRVDPCSQSPYLYILVTIFIYIFNTTIIISMFKYLIICCATRTHCGHACMAHHSVELGASKSICCCPLRPLPTYLSIYSSYYITL